jgi:hypothetical protein
MIQSIEEGRKEDGSRSIADKIIKRLHDLEKTVQSNYGRWAWELLQNAKDSVADTNRKVSVQIFFNANNLTFRHNGNHFTEKDIRGLINQISSKEVEEGEVSTRTGKFGTGFLTTHLLSKVVTIKGIVETKTGKYFKFNFPLDRNGKTTPVLIPKIENAWTQFHISTENSEIPGYDNELYNTSFSYELDSAEQKEIAKTGVDEFMSLIPYVLTFIPEILAVEMIDNTREVSTKFQSQEDMSDGLKKIAQIQNGKKSVIMLLFATNGAVSIAVRVKKNGANLEILSLDNIPRLFCDFPLIGSESFYFPVVVNSFYFNPQTERDGIWLMGDTDTEVIENKDLLIQAFELYKSLVTTLADGSYKHLFNIAATQMPSTDERYFDKEWYKNTIQSPLRQFLLTQPIVECEDGENGKLESMWFPLKGYTDEVREKLWQLNFDLFPKAVCRKDDLHQWIDKLWDGISRLTYAEFISDLAKDKSMAKLSESLGKDEKQTFKWYNDACSFIMDDEANHPLFEKNAVIPNENGTFLIKSALFINEINDDDLIEVLQLLGEDWNDILIHHKVGFGSYFTKKKNDIALKITEKLKNISIKNEDVIKAISILTEWFDNNPEEGKELFAETYRSRAELFMNTIQDKESLYKVMRSKTDLSKVAAAIEEDPRLFENMKHAKEVLLLMKEFNVVSLKELREVLEGKNTEGNTPLLPVTEEILANMGIRSVAEWKEAIKDKNLAKMFSHESTPTTDMFVYVQTLIDKAKRNIIAYLRTLPDYNLDNLDNETASTTLAGIIKDGITISIIARPAYNGEVIIYYGSERDILDYEPSELWIDDGKKPRKITLGHVLKKAQIVKFPV